MTIIQICGTNGTGKTTLVRNLMATGDYEHRTMMINGKPKDYYTDGKTLVIGKYGTANCGGVDAGNWNKHDLMTAIDILVQTECPETLIFEDIRFGGSGVFKQELATYAISNGHRYTIITLTAPAECTCNRVLNRSGNRDANYDRMLQKAKSIYRSSQRAKQYGAKVVVVDTEKNDEIQTAEILQRAIG